MDSKIWDNPIGLKVWMWCLLKASHKEKKTMIGRTTTIIKPGQFIYGRAIAAEELRQSPSTVRNWMAYLNQDNYLDIKTTNKFSIITIKNWEEYQKKDNKKDNKRTTTGHIQECIKKELINNRAVPSVDNLSGKVDNPPKRGMSDIADALSSSLDKMKKSKPARNVPEWMQHALEVADKLHIDWNHPELIQNNIKPRWFSLFKKKSWGELQSAYSFCYDYPNPPDSAGMVKLFFWKSGHKDLQLAP